MLPKRYSKDLDTLVALISHLALGKASQRTPKGLSADLSIDQAKIERVLGEYKSLFRKASQPKLDQKDIPYSLQLRYALQYVENEDATVQKPPIATEHVTALISFVTGMAKDERSWSIQVIVALVAALASFVVALIALAA